MKNKVKNAIKESKEEKESLFKEIKFKSQAAMEYLMTYGWAILIIALSLVVLYSLGITNPKNFIPRAPPGSCFVFRPNGPGTTDFISLQGTCGYLPMYVASFNGVNAYINCGNGAIFDTIINAITIGAWIKGNSWTRGDVASRWTGPYPWLFRVTGNGKLFFAWNGAPNAGEGNTILNTKQWYYVVVTYNGSNVRYWINGLVDKDYPVTFTFTSGGIVEIGANTYDGVYFNGLIANVQIYNTALTPQEIQYLYQQGLGGGPVRLQNLVAWWPLNGDAKDYSGNNNHGTIYGGVTFVQNYNPP